MSAATPKGGEVISQVLVMSKLRRPAVASGSGVTPGLDRAHGRSYPMADKSKAQPLPHAVHVAHAGREIVLGGPLSKPYGESSPVLSTSEHKSRAHRSGSVAPS